MSNSDTLEITEIMARLRDPESGCPWDLRQDFRSIAPYTIEEAYEVAHAIERGRPDEIREELGDLLFQVVFHARMAEERGWFNLADVHRNLCEKMIRRHPHVFGDESAGSLEDQNRRWEEIKASEKGGGEEGNSGYLDGVTPGLPPLRRSVKLQKRAARAGFDWLDARSVLDKIREETEEFAAELAAGQDRREALEDELGDMMFAVTNLARKLEIDPGSALGRSNLKFERRFRAMEALARESGQELDQLDLEALEGLWGRVKAEESGPQGS